jgi:uncharacterized protein YbjQ (UPF0145 family)
MKISALAQQFNLDEYKFKSWLQKSGYKIKSGFTGDSLEGDQSPGPIVEAYKASLAEQARVAAAAQAEAAAAEEKKKAALASMLITSGFNFDGFVIRKYSGYISGDSAVSMDRPSQGWLGGVNKDVGADILKGLSSIRRKALEELKEAAYDLGCNAVIGVDFDYLTMDPETASSGGGTLYLPFLFAVTANGNAVVIEKI